MISQEQLAEEDQREEEVPESDAKNGVEENDGADKDQPLGVTKSHHTIAKSAPFPRVTLAMLQED